MMNISDFQYKDINISGLIMELDHYFVGNEQGSINIYDIEGIIKNEYMGVNHEMVLQQIREILDNVCVYTLADIFCVIACITQRQQNIAELKLLIEICSIFMKKTAWHGEIPEKYYENTNNIDYAELVGAVFDYSRSFGLFSPEVIDQCKNYFHCSDRYLTLSAIWHVDSWIWNYVKEFADSLPDFVPELRTLAQESQDEQIRSFAHLVVENLDRLIALQGKNFK